jgi:ferrochelatase
MNSPNRAPFFAARADPLASPAGEGRIGILLVNLGTPDGTDYWSMRRYLKEFLSDRRVVETSRLIWWPVLNLIILTTRPGRRGRNYEKIWNKERDEGPLKTITRSQAEKLAAWVEAGGLGAGGLGASSEHIEVDWAMRYGNPSIKSGIERLKQRDCDRILILPLYPQYAAATSASVCDKAFEALSQMRWQPTTRYAAPYHNAPAYQDALAASVNRSLAALDFTPEVLLVSFHGIPKAQVEKGDPYYAHCVETYRLLGKRLGFSGESYLMSFQSRFGPAEWIQPYTDETVKMLARKGIKRLAVVATGFSADCLETIEELGLENRHYFLEQGGEHYAALPCLNDSEEGLAVIQDIVKRELAGWI